MPGLTATQFFTYPVGADAPCDATDTFKTMVDQIDDTLAGMRATIQRAKNPPMVIVEFNPPAPVQLDTIDNIEWNTVICDDGGFFDPGVPTIFTFPPGGRYMAGVNALWNGSNTRMTVSAGWDNDASIVTPGVVDDWGGSVSAFVVATDKAEIITPGVSWSDTPTPVLKWARFWAFLVADYA